MRSLYSILPGGRYRARQNADGTWDVLDVPIFSLVPKGTKGAPRDVTESDLRNAVATHHRKYSEDSFLPRLNVRHNYGIHKAEPAGFFLPRAVRPHRMGGTSRPVVFADLLAIPDEVFKSMDSGGLPYCSAEVRTYEPLTFGALALLDTEPPFFEFPLISIGSKESAEVTRLDDNGGPALAMASANGKSAFLFRFAEDSMDEDKKPDDEIEPGEANMEEGDGGDLKSAISAIEAKMKEFMPLLELLPKLQEMLAAPMEEDPPSDDVADEPVAAMSADTASMALQGRVAALEDYRANTEKRERAERLFSATVNSLESEGFNISESTKSRLRAAAEKGPDVLKLFSDGYRETGIKDPPMDLDGIPSGETAWPTEVMQYASAGAEVFAEAKAAFREWSSFPDDNHRSPLDRYLKREVG